jgi:hypothetical protein
MVPHFTPTSADHPTDAALAGEPVNADIEMGTPFHTAFQAYSVAITPIRADGSFLGYDDEGHIESFTTHMVTGTYNAHFSDNLLNSLAIRAPEDRASLIRSFITHPVNHAK